MKRALITEPAQSQHTAFAEGDTSGYAYAMRVIVLASVSLAASSIAFAACGGAIVDTPQDDAGTTATDSGVKPDSSAVRDSGPAPDATTGRDAAADSSIPPNDGGGGPGTPTPDQISCGATTCNSTTDVCCIDRNQAQTCITKGTTCDQGIAQGCDDKADCTGGDVCCGAQGAAGPAIECKPTCGSIQGFPLPQLCKTDSECGGGVPCVTTACSGRTIQTCGPINPLVKQAICR